MKSGDIGVKCNEWQRNQCAITHTKVIVTVWLLQIVIVIAFFYFHAWHDMELYIRYNWMRRSAVCKNHCIKKLLCCTYFMPWTFCPTYISLAIFIYILMGLKIQLECGSHIIFCFADALEFFFQFRRGGYFGLGTGPFFVDHIYFVSLRLFQGELQLTSTSETKVTEIPLIQNVQAQKVSTPDVFQGPVICCNVKASINCLNCSKSLDNPE